MSGSHALVFAGVEFAIVVFARIRQFHFAFGLEFGSFRISPAWFGRGMKIFSSLHIFMDLHPVFTHGHIRGMGINPGSAIEIIDAVLFVASTQCSMGMATEDARCPVVTGMGQRSRGDLG